MKRLPKKLLIISVSIISLGLVWGAWAMSRDSGTLVFESDKNVFLEAKPENTSRAQLTDWEKDLLSRQSATISRNLVNYTDSTARDLLSEYLKEQRANPDLDEQEFVQSFLKQRSPEELEKDINYIEYTISDLKISSKNDSTFLKSYGNKLGEVSAKFATDESWETELDILNKAAALNSADELKKLDPIITYYRNLVSAFLGIEVPAELADEHLRIVNSFSKIASIVESFKTFLDDPLRGVFALSNFAKYGFEIQNSLKEIDKYFKGKGVVFSETEYGYLIERAANAKAGDFQQ